MSRGGSLFRKMVKPLILTIRWSKSLKERLSIGYCTKFLQSCFRETASFKMVDTDKEIESNAFSCLAAAITGILLIYLFIPPLAPVVRHFALSYNNLLLLILLVLIIALIAIAVSFLTFMVKISRHSFPIFRE